MLGTVAPCSCTCGLEGYKATLEGGKGGLLAIPILPARAGIWQSPQQGLELHVTLQGTAQLQNAAPHPSPSPPPHPFPPRLSITSLPPHSRGSPSPPHHGRADPRDAPLVPLGPVESLPRPPPPSPLPPSLSPPLPPAVGLRADRPSSPFFSPRSSSPQPQGRMSDAGAKPSPPLASKGEKDAAEKRGRGRPRKKPEVWGKGGGEWGGHVAAGEGGHVGTRGWSWGGRGVLRVQPQPGAW